MNNSQEILDKARDVLANPSSPIPYDVYDVLADLIQRVKDLEEVRD